MGKKNFKKGNKKKNLFAVHTIFLKKVFISFIKGTIVVAPWSTDHPQKQRVQS